MAFSMSRLAIRPRNRVPRDVRVFLPLDGLAGDLSESGGHDTEQTPEGALAAVALMASPDLWSHASGLSHL
jgi:hypothetical protein